MKNKENKNELVEVSFYETEDNIIEQVYDPSKTPAKQFAVFIKATQKVYYTDHFELENGKILIPKQSALIDDKVVLLPTHASVYFTETDLITEIKSFVHTYLDISPFHENLVAHYVLTSWVFDRLSVVPYLRALGDYGTGKTRFIQTIGALCYKPMLLAGATSDAYIFRIIELFRGTLVINEFERVNTELNSQITIILNNGYEKGMPVGRVEGDKTREPKTYNVFCPKIFSTRVSFSDQALESRIISVPMQHTTRQDIPSYIDDEFWLKAQQLRNKLLLYRFKNVINPNLEQAENRRKRELVTALEPRLRQTFLPLLYVISEPALEKQFLSFAMDYQNQLIDARGLEINGMVFQKLYQLHTEGDSKISVKEVTDAVNAEIERDKYKLQPKRVGKIIRDELGLKTHKGTGGIYFIDIDEKQLTYLISRFGIESPLSPQSPLIDSSSEVDIVDKVELVRKVHAEVDMHGNKRITSDKLPSITEQMAIDEMLLKQGFDFNK